LPTISRNSTLRAGYFAGAAPNLLDALSEGMHTMAQPLTVLRATLEIAAGNACSVSHYQHAIDSSLAEITRISEAMGFVQELVRIARDAPEPSAMDLAAVVATVEEDLKCVLETAGIALEIDLRDDLPKVAASPSRVRQCLFYLMQHAVRACRSGGTIELAAQQMKREVHLVLRKWSSEPPRRESSDWEHGLWGNVIPSLMLAEALATGQEGRLEWQAEPFAACLSLPICHDAASRQETVHA
jgi:signal transduction histidine kinase